MITRTRTHTFITFANPNLVCRACRTPMPRFHNHERCGCTDVDMDRNPCCGQYGTDSACPDWNPVDGCLCGDGHPGAVVP